MSALGNVFGGGDGLARRLEEFERRLGAVARWWPGAVERLHADARAVGFHLKEQGDRPGLVVVLGGTGTGKSTLVNRLIGRELMATSFRRTFTAGAVAAARSPSAVPKEWLAVEHVEAAADALPARGRAEALVVAVAPEAALLETLTLVDTPDLDGDQPSHHAQADRAFRWAEGVAFVVTPEKYQMTELLPYYRLARRYGVASVFVMNKTEDPAAPEDFTRQLAERGWADVRVYQVPRDDAAYEPNAEVNLAALRGALSAIGSAGAGERSAGIAHRVADLVDRVADQVIAPARSARREADRLAASLAALEAPTPGVDVNPLTQQLQRRLQQRSILYLIGPQRILDRVRQVPGLLVRLPRTAWDVVMRGQKPDLSVPEDGARPGEVPDYGALLAEQFAVVQSRVDDVLRSSAEGARWIEQDPPGYAAARIDPAQAKAIAEEEIGELRQWLEKRWNATPRDTAILQKLVGYLPGGKKLAAVSEAAPYLLAVVLATHHAFLGPVDLVILGGYSLGAWLAERLSNEVASRTRATNRRIAERFAELGHRQIERAAAWVRERSADAAAIDALEASANRLAEAARQHA